MLLKLRAGWLSSAFFLLACDHTLVVGEHGDGDVPGTHDARPETPDDGAGGDPQRDATPDVALDSSIDSFDAPSEAAVDARDAPNAPDAAVDAKIADASETGDERGAADADASVADVAPDRPRVPGCLPDGAAGMTFRSSGGEDLDVTRGNEITCSSSVTGSQVSLTDKAGQILSGLPALETNLVFADLPRGHTGVAPVLVKITVIAGANPPVWTSTPTQCSASITTNAFVENEDGGALYEVGGFITCNGALAPTSDNSLVPLTISTFTFMTAAVYP